MLEAIANWCYTRDWPATNALAQILLVLVTATYVVLTRWTLNESRELARATKDLADATFRPSLVLKRPSLLMPQGMNSTSLGFTAWQYSVRSRIINEGAGAALSVRLLIGGRMLAVAHLVPSRGSAYHPELGKDVNRLGPVTLLYQDELGREYQSVWVHEAAIEDWRAANPDEVDAAK